MGKLKKKIYLILEMKDEGSYISLLVNTVIMTLIFFNVIAVILESVQEYHIAYAKEFWYFELVSIIIFSTEYCIRVWVSSENRQYSGGFRDRLRYMLTPMALIDLIAIIPFYLGMFINIDMRILRILRLFRVFKLSRHFAVMGILGSVLRNESKTLLSAIFIMFILVVLSAAGIYVVERTHQPDVFGSIPSAMWWATVTLTTVGYGDVVPLTVPGRLLGVVITVLGVGMAALPAGIIASGFTSELARRRDKYEMTARHLLRDGELDHHDHEKLDEKRESLGLAEDDAHRLLRKAAVEKPVKTKTSIVTCPHCGKSFDN